MSISVVGIGLNGAAGLASDVRKVVESATILTGGQRHLRYFPSHPAEKIPLSNFQIDIQKIE